MRKKLRWPKNYWRQWHNLDLSQRRHEKLRSENAKKRKQRSRSSITIGRKILPPSAFTQRPENNYPPHQWSAPTRHMSTVPQKSRPKAATATKLDIARATTAQRTRCHSGANDSGANAQQNRAQSGFAGLNSCTGQVYDLTLLSLRSQLEIR